MFITNIGNLISCDILKRINRFTVEVKIGNTNTLALLTNTGRLKDLIYEGSKGLCLKKEKVKKLEYILVGTYVNEDFATLIDTRLQMKIFEELVSKNMLDWLFNAKLIKRNVKVNNSFIDYLYKINDKEIYIEIKSAVLFDGYYSMYPDCPSIRGRKHVEEILKINKEGKKGMIVFIAAHPLAKAFKPSYEGDKILAEKITYAYKNNVEIRAIKLGLKYNGDVYLLDKNLPVYII